MSAFNILIATIECPVCEKTVKFEIQFKFGNTWQHRYKLGDKIQWGGNDIGRPNLENVIIEGIGGPCTNCATDYINFEIVIKFDKIIEVYSMGTKT